jgi:quercetin dioxygenase-like cupin family protein
MSILKISDIESREPVAGATVRFVHTENMTLAYWEFEAGVPLPEHAHAHEQIVNIIDGVFDLTMDGETNRLEGGAVAIIPPNTPHSARSITECQTIDVFFPVREDYR